MSTIHASSMIALSPKMLAVTMIGITLVAITISIVVSRPAEPQIPPLMRPVPDTDADGVPDDLDLLPLGNAGVRVWVHDFAARNSCGNILPLFNPKCQPEFTLRIDADQDGVWDGEYKQEFKDTNIITTVFDETLDVPDAATRVRLYLIVVDKDGGDTIDYWSADYSQFGSIEVSLRQGVQSLTMSGSGSVSASISFEISVVPY